MLQTIKNAWKIPELRAKILFTLMIVILYRVGAVVPVPYVSSEVLDGIMNSASGSLFQYINVLSGDAFSQATLFALSVSPYITSQIIMQLLTIAIPALERLSKDGEEGKKKINQISRYVTIGIAVVTAYGYYMYMKMNGVIQAEGAFAGIVIVACYVAGSALIMWLAEMINEKGIGNGVSIILFANILSGLPGFLSGLVQQLFQGGWKGIVYTITVIVIGLGMLVFIIFMSESERRLPIQYAKKVVGRKMYGGQSTNLPIKVNMSGVMPIIFANSILGLPTTIAALIKTPKEGTFWFKFLNFFSYTSWVYVVIFVILIIAFAYFYIAISFNPVEVSNNLKRQGGFIPGIRPGKPTSDYITKVLNKIILIGALMLCVVAALPLVINIITSKFGYSLGSLAFGGSSIIIVVGVVIELVRAIEAEMTMRHYKGFLE
ncbi:MAG: preprotein translocase subunit SecY [Ruminococcaceae bacterium]|nr:preprotein translocase subunit SecY [Oscillospiraceae bacterium]